MTQSVVVQGELPPSAGTGVAAEPCHLVAFLMHSSLFLAAGCSRTVREPDRLLLLGPGAQGACRGQPGTRPLLPVTGPASRGHLRFGVGGGVLWILLQALADLELAV